MASFTEIHLQVTELWEKSYYFWIAPRICIIKTPLIGICISHLRFLSESGLSYDLALTIRNWTRPHTDNLLKHHFNANEVGRYNKLRARVCQIVCLVMVHLYMIISPIFSKNGLNHVLAQNLHI